MLIWYLNICPNPSIHISLPWVIISPSLMFLLFRKGKLFSLFSSRLHKGNFMVYITFTKQFSPSCNHLKKKKKLSSYLIFLPAWMSEIINEVPVQRINWAWMAPLKLYNQRKRRFLLMILIFSLTFFTRLSAQWKSGQSDHTLFKGSSSESSTGVYVSWQINDRIERYVLCPETWGLIVFCHACYKAVWVCTAWVWGNAW